MTFGQFVLTCIIAKGGVDIDLKARTFSLKWADITLGPFPWARAREAYERRDRLAMIIEHCFTLRGAMWINLYNEDSRDVLSSLKELEAILDENLGPLRAPEDELVRVSLKRWSDLARQTAKGIRQAVEMANDPADAGMDTSARDTMRSGIRQLRIETYPLIRALIEILPEGDRKTAAESQLEAGANLLTATYGVAGSNAFAIPNVIEDDA